MSIDDQPNELLPLLIVSGHLVEDQLDVAVEPFGFTVRRLGVLKHLVQAGGSLPLGALVGPLHCGKSNVTQVVDRLEAQGLARRVPDPNDRRGVLAEITSEGRRRFEAAAPSLDAAERQLASRFTPEEGRQLVDLLGRFLRSLQRERVKPAAALTDQPAVTVPENA
jgi:DNA-binding MarR family transcriptional regulator